MININKDRQNGTVNAVSKIGDLVALSNIERNSLDTRVVEVGDSYIVVEGRINYEIKNKYAVAGGEVIKIVTTMPLEEQGDTVLVVERCQFNTPLDINPNDHVRTVVVLDPSNNDLTLTNWEFENTLGSINSNLFPVELGSGSISIISDLKLWSPHSTAQRFRVKPRRSVAYLFKNIDDTTVLKFTTIITKIKFNTRGKTEPNKIVLDIKTFLAKWYDKDIAINSQLKGTEPKEFFKLIFDLRDEDIYYSDGVDKTSLLSINNLHTKEYKTVSEILKAYCSNGVRFIFDAKERLRIFADFKVQNLSPVKAIDYSITNLMLSENEQLIYNSIDTEVYQRQTLYNFEDLDNKYVKFFKKLNNVVMSSSLIERLDNGDYSVKVVKIQDKELHSSVQLKDYVVFKRTKSPYVELPAQVISIESDDYVVIMPILKDKDYKLFHYGKSEYLYDLLVTHDCPLDLHYVRASLPIIFKYSRNIDGTERDSSLDYPILPKVDGKDINSVKTNVQFGCASNLQVGEYTGIIEEVDKIYGLWNKDSLKYNREIEQFANKKLPPIFALSNKVEERVTSNGVAVKRYTTFDNSNLELNIEKPKDNKNDAMITMTNTVNVNSDIDLFTDVEIARKGNRILQVDSIGRYRVGDVLVVNKPSDMSLQEEVEYNDTISKIKWVVTNKETQTTATGEVKHYIFLDSNFAKRRSLDKKYSFTVYPNYSIVYLQELYFRGNPVIEYKQSVSGTSSSTNIDGDTSVELYGSKNYSIDSKQLDNANLKLMMGYILNNFQATDRTNTKFTLPLSVFDSLELECLDIISINDPVITGIDNNMLWLIVSERVKSNTNEIEYKLININSKDTEPYNIDVQDVIEYKPIEIPQYSHTGGEGNPESNNDGQGGTDTDNTLGQFWLAEVSPTEFRCRVEKFENNRIYFTDFNGTKHVEYKSKLFPVSEFAVNIKGEIIFVQSDMNYRAYIKKRQVYDTQEVSIAVGDDVTFLVTTTYVDLDGTFYSRKMMVGDGDNYLSVDTIKGVKVVGDFVVGENNKNPSNDLWQSMQNNRTFHAPEQPKNTPQYSLKIGDIWYDTDDENHCYRYDGKVWVSARDGSIVSSKNNVYIQPEEPVGKEGKPLLENDTWYDTNNGNRPHVYREGKWIPVSDTTLQAEIDKVNVKAEHNKKQLGELYNDSIITPSEKKQIVIIVSEIKAEYPKYKAEAEKFGISTQRYEIAYTRLQKYVDLILQNPEMSTEVEPSVFKDSFDLYYNARGELISKINVKIEESAVNSAKSYTDKVKESLSKDLESQIDGKIDTYSQEEDPSTLWNDEQKVKHTGDLWYVPSQKITKRWNGVSWDEQAVKDEVAQNIAKTKRTVYTEQPTPPYEIGDLWVTDLVSHGDMKVCKTRRESGIYISSDWVNATKYTDDTFAKEVERQTEKAQQTADRAQEKLADIANDNKLTPSEKQETQKDWEIIKGEYQKIIDQCLLYGIVSTEYSQAYNSLSAYLTPLLSDMSETTGIVGSTFRQYFSEYYSCRQEILNRVAKKAKDLTEKAQNDATTALGNAKIFYQTSPPNSGMKENDLWYDTDDQNHPHIYTKQGWKSARDMVYETDGGNKVIFSPTQPDIEELKLKVGDMWFDESHNNICNIIVKVEDVLQWTVLDDAKDSIAQGRLVINQNTVFNGDATFISSSSTEQIKISNGAIEFTREGRTLTRIKNIAIGSLVTDFNGKGVVSFEGFKKPIQVLTTLKSFQSQSNIASLNCYSEDLGTSDNRFRFYLSASSEYHTPPTPIKYHGSKVSFSNSLAHTFISAGGVVNTLEKRMTGRTSAIESSTVGAVRKKEQELINSGYKRISYDDIPPIDTYPTMELTYVSTVNGYRNILAVDNIRLSYTKVLHGSGVHSGADNDKLVLGFDNKSVYKAINSFKKHSKSTVELSIESRLVESQFRFKKYYYIRNWRETSGGMKHRIVWNENPSFTVISGSSFRDQYINYSTESSVISDLWGEGEVQYIAMEID